MSKFVNLMLVVVAIQLVLISTGVVSIPGDVLFNFIINPSSWNNNAWSSLISDLILGVSGVAIIIGLLFFKNDFIVFAPMVGVLFSFGIGLYNLYALVQAQINSMVAIILISPIILIYIMGVLEWWRAVK